MNDVIVAVITILITGFGSGGILTAFLNYRLNKTKEQNEKLYKENKDKAEETISNLELLKELYAEVKDEVKTVKSEAEMYIRDNLKLRKYAIEVTHSALEKGVKSEELPKMPELESDKII